MFDAHVLDFDPTAEAARIEDFLRTSLRHPLRKRGLVLGVSGGVDSSVCLALAVRALGPKRVVAIAMPERDSSGASLDLARALCAHVGVDLIVEDLSATLEAQGCYRRRDDAIRSVIPEYAPTWRQKIVLPQDLLKRARLNVFYLVAQSPDGETRRVRLPLKAYLEIVAATNMKQRSRKQMEYYYADRHNYAVIGTPNRLEYDQGFFVKNGDGAADIKPIAHLYKTQVYALAESLGLPAEIVGQVPCTDTYSLPQTQEEFYFCLPYGPMDLALWALEHEVPAAEAGPVLGLPTDAVERVYADIVAKRRSTRYGHLSPLLVEPVPSVHREVGTSE